MEKFILVPYEKYQRILQPSYKGFGEVKDDQTIPPKVSLPPPGQREKKTKSVKKPKMTLKTIDKTINWIY